MNGILNTYRGKPLVKVWTYLGESDSNHSLMKVARYEKIGEKKEFVPYHQSQSGSWVVGAIESDRPLYGLDLISKSKDSDLILVVEGEKCASALQSLGYIASTSLGGAQAAHLTDWSPLSGKKKVCIIPDNDDPGEKYAMVVGEHLNALPNPPNISIFRFQEIEGGGDVVDWIQKEFPDWDGYEDVSEKAAPFLKAKLDPLLRTAEDATFRSSEITVQSQWPAPISLDHPSVCEWPLDVFPEPIEKFVHALSKATETPVDLPAMMVFSALSTAVQGKYHILVKPGYFEPLNLWICVALPSGNRKSAIVKAVTNPLIRWETDKELSNGPEEQRMLSMRKTQEQRIKKLRSDSVSKGGDAWEQACEEIWQLESELPTLPTKKQLWTTDITPETLGDKLAENQETMAVISDEGGIFDLMAGRYSNGIPNLDVFLQGHAGSSIRVNRKNQKAVTLHAPALTMGLSPQPAVIESLASKPGFRGRGLLARFLYAVPPSQLGHRLLETEPVALEIVKGYEDVIYSLLDHPVNQDDRGIHIPKQVRISPDAYELWLDFSKEVEHGMKEDGLFGHLTDWAGKLPGAVARISGNLHLAKYAGTDSFSSVVDEVIMEKAIRIGRALSERALATFSLMGGDPTIEGARIVLNWIKKNKFREFTLRDCFKAHQSRFKRVQFLRFSIDVLCERFYIAPRLLKEPVGHRKSEWYDVNPLIFGD